MKHNFNPLKDNPDLLTTLKKKPLENIVGKGEKALNQHFLTIFAILLRDKKPAFQFH